MAEASKPPPGLAAAGRKLWRSILDDLDDDWELDVRELGHLERASRCADRIAELEKSVKADGLVVPGSRGQRIVHPAVAEIRQTELVRLRLLSALELADPEGVGKAATPAQARARRAAQARWANRDVSRRAIKRGDAG